MSDHDALHDRGRAIEEEYFRRKDRELVERIRQKAAAEEAQRALGASTGVSDPEVLHELQALGFTPETVALLPLMPVLQIAWAEGGVTPVERLLIEKLATARGIEPGGAADAQLMDWLANKPSDTVFHGAARLIHALLESGSGVMADLSAERLVDLCEQVASVSGGVFGLGRVSREEKDLLASIAADLGGRKS